MPNINVPAWYSSWWREQSVSKNSSTGFSCTSSLLVQKQSEWNGLLPPPTQVRTLTPLTCTETSVDTNVHTFETPIRGCQVDTPVLSLANGRYSGNETHGYTLPTLQCTPLMWQMLGWPGTLYINPWYDSYRWHNYQRRCPMPIEQLHSTFSLQTAFCPLSRYFQNSRMVGRRP